MSVAGLWVVMLGGMAVTIAIRLSFVALLPIERLPARLRDGLRYVPPAVLAALVLPALLRPDGSLDLTLGNVWLLAGALAALVAWRTGNIWLTILAGMAAVWALSAL